MSASITGSLLITYAVVQTIVFLVLLRLADPYEREPISALALMTLWGAVGATTISAVGNVTVRSALDPEIAAVYGQAIYAPVVEEMAKGIALVAFVLVARIAAGRLGMPRFDGVTDGIVYGAAIGLGFAFTEDVLYLLVGAANEGLEQGLGTFLSRRDFFGLSMFHHAIYTGVFGVGLGLASWSRKRATGILVASAGMVAAVALHALNNGWVRWALVREHGFDATLEYVRGKTTSPMGATATDAAGFVELLDMALIAGLVIAIALWLRYQRRVIQAELADEAREGLLTRGELDLLPRFWLRTAWYWQLIRSGQWERQRILQRIHNELVSLALLKHRSKRQDIPSGAIDERRELIEKLKAQKVVFL